VVLVAQTFAAGNSHATEIRSLSLLVDGTLVDNGMRLDVGVPVSRLEFVPSGEVALALGEDGDLVSIRVNAADDLQILGSVPLPSADMTDLRLTPDGRVAFAVGLNVAETSGVSTVLVGCDGSLAVLAPAFLNLRLATSLVLVPGTDRAVLLGGQTVFEPIDDDDLRLLRRTGTTFSEVGAFDIWQDFFTTGRMALTPDGATLLVPNNSMFSDETSQVLVVAVGETTLTETQRVTELPGASEVIISPDGTTALVSQLDEDRVRVLGISGGQVTLGAAITGIGLADQMAMVSRGSLAGLVLVSSVDPSGEPNLARLRFTGPGTVENLGQTDLGAGVQNIPGALAITP
jgi:hypothetical protein